MKFKVQAGAEIDTLTRGELAAELAHFGASWRAELARGATFKRASMWGTVTAGGVLTLGETGDQWIGPAEGMVWACKRITVGAGYTPASQTLRLYRNSSGNDSALIHPDLTGYDQLYDEPLSGGDRLVVAGSSLTAAAVIWVTVIAREVPEFYAGRL